ncbi:hypothetical protein [Halanaerobium praevalens]|uniref:Uncharacterized protein n=1 Tax=Halanaerobium praevalens (strain ATCC 33744 / DSM 2228 / GSL) TaxID=572479 RepID=E3DLH4_HALPG|nr:hypothetical protein [Halanaerobium praevalens]ADO77213.1 hypothetical protein Hprae_1061 [Halanaerobium praevalens DSM 2228]
MSNYINLINKINNNLVEKIKNANSAISEEAKKEIGEFMLIWFYLGSLSIVISSSHAIYSRYVFPDEGKSPLKIYNEKHSIIKNYNDIYDLLKNCISIYENLIDKGKLPYKDDFNNAPFFNSKIY